MWTTVVAGVLGGTLAQAPVAEPRNPIADAIRADRAAETAGGNADNRPISSLPAEPSKVGAAVQVKSELGNNFKLVEVRVLVNGAEVARRAAPEGGELEKSFKAFDGALPEGQHTMTAHFRYQGRNRGFFSYMEAYTFNAEAIHQLNLAKGQPVALTVVATERPGITVPIEQKPVLHFEAGGPPSAQAAAVRR